MDIVGLWGQTIKDAIGRFAKSQSKETRAEYEQECLLHLLEIQDVISRIYNEQGEAKARNYVYAVCHHKISKLLSDWTKRSGFEISINDPSISRELEHYSSRQIPDLGITEQELDEAVKLLSRAEQHIIRSIYFQGISERDLAKSLQRPKTWVHNTKQEAISKLREFLQ